MTLYTGTGDHGETGLFGNRRVPKGDARIEAYGSLDELNGLLGLLRCEGLPEPLDRRLGEIQSTLFDAGADLATEGGDASVARVGHGCRALEVWIDESEQGLPRLTSFILPGGHREAALFHFARTVARRAERRFWDLMAREREGGTPPPEAIGIYLNRLSDLLFSWARSANARHGIVDVPWTRPAGG